MKSLLEVAEDNSSHEGAQNSASRHMGADLEDATFFVRGKAGTAEVIIVITSSNMDAGTISIITSGMVSIIARVTMLL